MVARLWRHTKSNSIIVAQSRIPFKGSGRVFRLFVLENRLFRPVYSLSLIHICLEKAIDRVFLEVDRAYKDGANIIILSDRCLLYTSRCV